jgi:anti-sigma regulatory factor (Ser/Thr protein kinase)
MDSHTREVEMKAAAEIRLDLARKSKIRSERNVKNATAVFEAARKAFEAAHKALEDAKKCDEDAKNDLFEAWIEVDW